MSAPGFHHVETWIFDLDNTLYPASCRLFDQIDVRMGEFISNLFEVDKDAGAAHPEGLLLQVRHDAARADGRAQDRPGRLPRLRA
jgi:FMN phosphatase YigB (HAD superfamily)